MEVDSSMLPPCSKRRPYFPSFLRRGVAWSALPDPDVRALAVHSSYRSRRADRFALPSWRSTGPNAPSDSRVEPPRWRVTSQHPWERRCTVRCSQPSVASRPRGVSALLSRDPKRAGGDHCYASSAQRRSCHSGGESRRSSWGRHGQPGSNGRAALIPQVDRTTVGASSNSTRPASRG